MRLALIADIHGNLHGFEAALADARRRGFDQLVILGDVVVGAPDSVACWELARSLGCPIVRGNQERYVADVGTPRASPAWATEQFGPLAWTVARFDDAARAAMGALPLTLRLGGFDDTLLVHASARNDRDTVAAHTPDAALADYFAGAGNHFLLRGHNHVGQVRPWGERCVITAPSAGLPLDGHPTAQYALLERRDGGGGSAWRVEFRSVEYDLDAALSRFHETDYLRAAGPIARLFMRELATATKQIIPFFRAYQRWTKESAGGKAPTLNDAIDRFLTMC